MKRVMLLTLLFSVLFTGYQLESAFAYPGGLLNGLTLNRGTLTTAKDTTTSATDNNLTTGTYMDATTGDYLWYAFPVDKTIGAYQVKTQPADTGTLKLRLYSASGTLLYDQLVQIDGTKITLASPVSDVRKVALFRVSASPSIYEFDVFAGVAPDTTPPAKPTNLNAVPALGSVLLNWSANAESDIAGYNIYKNGVKQNASLITGTTYNASGVLSNTTFYWKVTAVDTSNNESPPSDQVSTLWDTISPLAPIGLTAVTGSAQGNAQLSWIANSETDLAGYNVYKDNAKVNVGIVTVPNYLVTGLLNNTNYVFAVTALDTSNNESEKSASVNYFFDTVPPVKPVGLHAVGGNQKITLSWTPNTESDLAGYYVYDDLNQKVNQALIVGTSYEVNNLAVSTSYTFRLTAVDKSGNESPYSDVATATTLDELDTVPPSTPKSFTVTKGNESALLAWNPNMEQDLAGYNVYMDDDKINAALVLERSYSVLGLENGQTYKFQVSAVDTYGNESDLTSPLYVTPSAQSIPQVGMGYSLKDVADSTTNWFMTLWLILAFAIGIPLSFVVANRIKQTF